MTITAPPLVFESAADFDTVCRAEATRRGTLVPRLSGLPIPPHTDTPIIVYSDPGRSGGIDYRTCGFTSPIPHSPEGLVAEILYSALGQSAYDQAGRRGTFSFHAEAYTAPDGSVREPSQIAIAEKTRLASTGLPYRPPVPVVFDTTRTLEKTISALSDVADPLARTAVRVLKVASSMPYCPQLPIITRMAGHLFYLPEHLSGGGTRVWCERLSIAPLTPVDDAYSLWRALTAHSRLDETGQDTARTLANSAASALVGASIASARAAIRTNAFCEHVAACFTRIEELDANLRPRARAAGAILTGTLQGAGEGVVELVGDTQVMRFKRGDRMSITIISPTGGDAAEIHATIDQVTLDASTARIRLVPSRPRKITRGGEVVEMSWTWTRGQLSILVHGAQQNLPVILAKAVMSPYTARIASGRWLRGTQREPITRTPPQALTALMP